jgi:hypothetical protein
MASQALVDSVTKEIVRRSDRRHANRERQEQLVRDAASDMVRYKIAKFEASTTPTRSKETEKLERWSNGMMRIGVSALLAPFTAVLQHSVISFPYMRPSA